MTARKERQLTTTGAPVVFSQAVVLCPPPYPLMHRFGQLCFSPCPYLLSLPNNLLESAYYLGGGLLIYYRSVTMHRWMHKKLGLKIRTLVMIQRS